MNNKWGFVPAAFGADLDVGIVVEGVQPSDGQGFLTVVKKHFLDRLNKESQAVARY